MPSAQSAPPSPAAQRAVAEQVLETMANIRILPGEVERRDVPSAQGLLASSLAYTAPASQLLLLECSPELALQLTAHLFDRPRPTSAEDPDTIEIMAELVNMIGGNLKALMPANTLIGLPSVTDPQQTRALVQDARELSQLWLNTSFGPLGLTFFAKDTAPGQTA